jgi:GxxExxY protein
MNDPNGVNDTAEAQGTATTHHGGTEAVMLIDGHLTDSILAAAIEVHRTLGPGLLESAYEECLCHELTLRGLAYRRQVALPLNYKGVEVECGYRMDLLVQDAVILELKCVEKITGIHEAQLLTYLRLSGMKVGLLINFNVPALRQGIARKVL